MFVEIGNAKNTKKGWCTLDSELKNHMFKDGTIHLAWHAPDSFPFDDNSVELIYSSHFFEHLYWEDSFAVLKDCKRVLMKGKKLLIALPNAELYINAYVAKNKELLRLGHYDSYEEKEQDLDLPINIKSNARRINPSPDIFGFVDSIQYLLTNHNHRQLYDYDKIKRQVLSAGFSSCQLRDFDPGLDEKKHVEESFYVTATY